MANAATIVSPQVRKEFESIAAETRIFVNMPSVSGITPRVLLERGMPSIPVDNVERHQGVFRPDEIGLPAFDHGVLYGDAVFEGILIIGGQLFQWREHVERLYRSAKRLGIQMPYDSAELTEQILGAVNDPGLSSKGAAYIRLVVTRGIGDLGINPVKCLGSTIYALVSKIQLYPESLYEQGIRVSVAQQTRRAGADIIDPQIKCCNYVNNILALVETQDQKTVETIMLTRDGFVAEATTDNLFLVSREPGWEESPARITLLTPSAEHCLKGITRELVFGYAKRLGFQVKESSTMAARDLIGPGREVFLTGTAAGLIPVIAVDGHDVGDGTPGPVTTKLRELLAFDMMNPAKGLFVHASRNEIERYLQGDGLPSQGAMESNDGDQSGLIVKLFDKVDSRNWDELNQVFCQDVTYERPGYEPLQGYERVKYFYREERVIASGKHFLENIVTNRESGACWGRFIGVHKNSSPIDERFADVYTFKDSKILTRKSYFFRPAV
jgi:branched-chain amino acid aminotransferase